MKLNNFKETHTPIIELYNSGKVRNIYDFTGMVFETSNRLSVFDRVIKDDVPYKGACLNCISQCNKIVAESHGIQTDIILAPRTFFKSLGFQSEDIGKLSYSKRLMMFPFEFIVRAVLTGSMWAAYKKGEPYCGIVLPDGLKEGDMLPNPIVTPTTKESSGHDRPVTKKECIEMTANWLLYGGIMEDFDMVTSFDEEDVEFAENCTDDTEEQTDLAMAHNIAKGFINQIYEKSLNLFDILTLKCRKKQILFVDTKFEYGLDCYGDIILGDEVGTPDSSRFALLTEYKETGKIVSMDKQIVRDYCKSVGFTGDENQDIPEIPDEVWEKVTQTYLDITKKLCGVRTTQSFLKL